MERGKFGREFKLEAVNLVRERGVSCAQAPLSRHVLDHALLRARMAGCQSPRDLEGIGHIAGLDVLWQ